MIRQVKFVGIPTKDQERALKFWTEIMGLKVLTDQPLGHQRWIELQIPGAQTRLVLFTPRVMRIASARSSTDRLAATTSNTPTRS